MKNLLFALLVPFISFGQTQIGQDIEGINGNDVNYFGESVSISSDGTIMAAGAPSNDGINGTNSGHTRIYENINGIWTQIGNDIDGEAEGDLSGTSVSLSYDGSILAVGAPGNDGINGENSGHVRVYQNMSGTWTQIGNDIDGEAEGDLSGTSVSLSSDGSIVAIGAYNNSGSLNGSGHVRVYQNMGGTWTQIGNDIDGDGGWFGYSLSLSDDGNTLIVGAFRYSGPNGNQSGLARIYQNINGIWTQIGNDINGDATRDQLGHSVDLSSDGTIAAIGARQSNGSILSSGDVRVYQNIGNVWTQLGSTIDAELGDDIFGYSLSLSSDGYTLAVGAPLSDTTNYRSGLVRVYKYNGFTWNSVGSDVRGEGKLDFCGESVSLSSDGNTLVIGASRNSGNGYYAGHVRVYQNMGGTWTQIGNDIDGDLGVSRDALGESVSVSSDGTTIAIGAPRYDSAKGSVRVYENKNGVWTQKGLDIIGEANHDLSGSVVSLSSNGNIVAIGAPRHDGINGFNSGYVRVFKFNNGNWIQIGTDIFGPSIITNFGESISLSSDGNILAIDNLIVYQNIGGNWVKLTEDIDEQSAIGSEIVSLSSNGKVIALGVPSDPNIVGGRVYIFENINGIWTQKGNDILGEAEFDRFGSSLSLSSNGNIIAIGAPFNDGENGSDSGHVRVYEYLNGTWTQIGDDIDGEASNDYFGERGISLSSSGEVLAIGSSRNEGANDSFSGYVRIYKNINGVWNQIGNTIDGEAAGDQFGRSVSLSSDGSIVAIGAPFNDGNAIDSGHVRVYDLSAVLSTQSFEKDYFSYYPNPAKDILNIQLNKGLELKQVNIYNLQSQYLYSVKTSKIDLSKLSSGMYFIEVETNQGKSAKKIIIE
ncbi:T9SS type A sorting domain-containing protein [Hyunsoonleella rubra]|uniref:T9SS type A sorting domain-containing protein n=1 Tax=Hyunsoonleella rubra TaxID=1737062 RepID=A0ABW5TBF6_9FLAO